LVDGFETKEGRGWLGEAATEHERNPVVVGIDQAVRAALPTAGGALARVVAVFVDLRGFSVFHREVEAPEAAAYLRCFYQRLLDNYFKQSNFFKLTGDGMMLIFEYPEFPVERLGEICNVVVHEATQLIADFSSLCSDDPNVYFETRPSGVGIGIARGSSYRLESDGTTLDYSGRPLNMAARLMELARPQGIVVEQSVFRNLSEKLALVFTAERVYVRGGAESQPIQIHYTADQTTIPADNKRPLDKPKWQRKVESLLVSQLRAKSNLWWIDIPSAPRKPDEINTALLYPVRKGGKVVGRRLAEMRQVELITRGTEYFVQVNVGEAMAVCRRNKIPLKSHVRIQIDYEE
jgi:class 3 adenylate cyclase